MCDCEVIDNKVVIGDGFECNISAVDLEDQTYRDGQVLAGAGPEYLAAQDNTLWHSDLWSHCLIRTGPNGRLLDWGEKPIWETGGLAFDGGRLWVLDTKENRVCAVDKEDQVAAP